MLLRRFDVDYPNIAHSAIIHKCNKVQEMIILENEVSSGYFTTDWLLEKITNLCEKTHFVAWAIKTQKRFIGP